jgi:hypothetical protein
MRAIRPWSDFGSAVAIVTAMVLVPPVAAAASVGEIVEKYALVGTWAADCANPPGPQNPHVIYQLLGADRLQREVRIAPGQNPDISVATAIVEIEADELMMSWKTSAGGVTNRVRAGQGRMQVVDSTLDTGQKIFANGRRIRDDAEAPKFNKCSGG